MQVCGTFRFCLVLVPFFQPRSLWQCVLVYCSFDKESRL